MLIKVGMARRTQQQAVTTVVAKPDEPPGDDMGALAIAKLSKQRHATTSAIAQISRPDLITPRLQEV